MTYTQVVAIAGLFLAILTGLQIPLLILMYRIGSGQSEMKAQIKDVHDHVEAVESEQKATNKQVLQNQLDVAQHSTRITEIERRLNT